MEKATVGHVLTEATIESLKDLYASHSGLIPAHQIHRVVVPDALVNSDTMLLSLPSSMIRRLGLVPTGARYVPRGGAPAVMYDPVRLTLQGRDCTMDVLEAPEGAPVQIGRIPLLHLDLVVDLATYKLTGNPAHGEEHVYEMY